MSLGLHPNADFTSTCSKTEVNDIAASLGMTCDQNIASPSHYSLSGPELLMQIGNLAIQIPQDTGLVQILQAGRKFSLRTCILCY